MLIIGHRGARGLAPENTLASFEAALQNGADGIECDVRVSKDGVAVLCHDPFFLNGSKQVRIAYNSYARLKQLKPELITLDELLRRFQHRTYVIIELKPGIKTQPVIDCLKTRIMNDLKPEGFEIASFDYQVLSNIKQALPSARICINHKWSGMLASSRARRLGTKRITMQQRWLWSGFIKAMKKRGFILSAYTINDTAKAKRWAKQGLARVITDYPDRYR